MNEHKITCGDAGVSCICGYKSSANGHEHAHILAMDHAKMNPGTTINHEESVNNGQ